MRHDPVTRSHFSASQGQLVQLSLRLQLALERRRITQALCAERIGIARWTLRRLEAGSAAAGIGTLLCALRVLGLDADWDKLWIVCSRRSWIGLMRYDVKARTIRPGLLIRCAAKWPKRPEVHPRALGAFGNKNRYA